MTRGKSAADEVADLGDVPVEGATHRVEVGEVVADVVGEFVVPLALVPLEAGLPTIEETVPLDVFVRGLPFESVPCIERIHASSGVEQVPQVEDVAALALLDHAAEFLGADLGERVPVDLCVLRQVAPVDEVREAEANSAL